MHRLTQRWQLLCSDGPLVRDENGDPVGVTVTLPVRSYDIDFGGIVSNIVYVRWMEDLRLALLDRYSPLDEMVRQGFAPVLMSTKMEYLRPVKLFEQLVGRLWVTTIGTVRLDLAAEFVVDGEVRAKAKQACCCVRLASGRPVRVPEGFARFVQPLTGKGVGQ